ncbi:hypothetical protein ACS0TY_016820 [Phlomoides rotata]
MLSCPVKLSASRLRFCPMPRTVLPNFAYVIERTTYSSFRASLLVKKNISPCIGLFSSYRVLSKDINTKKSHTVEYFEGIKSDSLEEVNLTENVHIDKEIQRTEKVIHGNKGRVPWNKGKKHSEETRERIRSRTKEALKDPKVRKKMSEAPRTLSNQTKVKIRASLTKLWGERLKWKRSREKFLQSWAESIAEAAKKGGSDQQELEWDSYDRLVQEIALQQKIHEAEIAKAKEMARIRAERAAQVKAEKMARLSQKRREREEKAKVRGESTKKRNKRSKEEKEKLAEFQEEKLKERLMKIRKKKSTISQVSNQHQRSWEKIDLDTVKGEQLQKDVSLAELIRFAKNTRAQHQLDNL